MRLHTILHSEPLSVHAQGANTFTVRGDTFGTFKYVVFN